MKVSTNQYFTESTRHLTDQQGQIAKLQAKLATGEKFISPSDDPDAAVKGLSLKSIMAVQDVQMNNMLGLEARLGQEESIISTMRNMITRMQELAVMGNNATFSESDREAMAMEVRGYRDEMLSLANSRDDSGAYLFSGASTGNPPFVAGADDSISYTGDATRLYLEMDVGQLLEINTTGYELFSGGSGTPNSSIDVTGGFAVFDDFANALDDSDMVEISASLSQLDSVRASMETATSKLGLRRNMIDLKKEINVERQLILQSMLSRERDLDYTKAITELSSRMLALEAAQSTMAKISQLTLFNYLS
jgi:flagellar hook-associated protein 3 FlgL